MREQTLSLACGAGLICGSNGISSSRLKLSLTGETHGYWLLLVSGFDAQTVRVGSNAQIHPCGFL